jgi:hypothetical protein
MDILEYNRFVDSARELNYLNRPKEFVYTVFDRIQYAKEFQTVRLEIGRQCGKTTYVIQNAKPWDLVVTHNGQMAENLVRKGCRAKVVTVNTIFTNLWPSEYFKTIFFDSCLKLNKDFLFDVYERHAIDETQQFVILD